MSGDGASGCYRTIVTPCECTECQQQFLTGNVQLRKTGYNYTSGLSDSEAHLKATALSERIAQDYQFLQTVWPDNKRSIVKRWKKRSQDKRELLLLKVDPNMYPYNWSETYFYSELTEHVRREYYDEGKEQFTITGAQVRRQHRNICLLPYVNLELLKSNSANFLNLLFNRIKYSPQQWASYDNYLLKNQWEIGSFETEYNRYCIVMRGPNYGSYTKWDELAVHSGLAIGFPRGILVLEAQQRLMGFLRGMVEELLPLIVLEKPILCPESGIDSLDTEFSGQKRPQTLEFASTWLSQPFSPPPEFDIKKLLSITQAQRGFHGDHLRLLQTDPDYMRRYAALFLAGGLGENLEKTNRCFVTAENLIQDTVTYWTWDWVLGEIQKLETLHEAFEETKYFTEAYKQSLGSVETLLEYLIQRRSRELDWILCSRPGFRGMCEVQYVQEGVLGMARKVENRLDVHKKFFEDRLEFCLSALVQDFSTCPKSVPHPDRGVWYTPETLFGILEEHLTDCSGKLRKEELARLDEILYGKYSELAAMHELLSILRLHHPLAGKLTLEEAKNTQTGKAWRYISKSFLEEDGYGECIYKEDGTFQFQNGRRSLESEQMRMAAAKRLAEALKVFIEAQQPKGSRFTKIWLEMDEKQRIALSHVWDKVRSRHKHSMISLGLGNDDIASAMKDLRADSDPKYISRFKDKQKEILSKISDNLRLKEKARVGNMVPSQWAKQEQKAGSYISPRIGSNPKLDQPVFWAPAPWPRG
jgi:hypothetical protein